MERKLQTEIIQWLRSQGVYVIKTSPGAGTPVGCLDIIGLYQYKWLAIEVKAYEKAPDRPLQLATQAMLRAGNKWVYRVWPDNWPFIKEILSNEFF